MENSRLCGQLPVIIEGDSETGDSWEEVAEEVDDVVVVDAEVTRRSHSVDANTRGNPDPVILSDGNMILDLMFYQGLQLFGDFVPYQELQEELEGIDGVVTCGLVCVSKKSNVEVYRVDDVGMDLVEVL